MSAPRCTGKKTSGDDCLGWRVAGSDKCRRHLPNPKARANAAVRAEVLRLGFTDRRHEPADVLMQLLSLTYDRVERYSAEIETMVADSPSLREALVKEAYGEFGPTGEYVRGMVDLESRERDRLMQLTGLAIKAGLATRAQDLAERQGAVIEMILRAVLVAPELGLSSEQRAAVPGLIRAQLALVS